ncbi:MAG: PLP-dependent aminotransferase family protein [Eubacterium sp.]|nr:PLP-dependent aminotransferase family protein [Eubacterium sp.]MCM1303228.1 PLP-dependent aminotransferase family protein [Butyrivibrio sp.]MCM1343193.1 PLP-dependent aminotransferase family protein [Muribaculaceae bacterium]MCM1409543.1 PLP-dependent aminotransferase family protein [Lachnospiraceae bacterium]
MYDMTIELRTDSDKCLYEQIYDHIKTEIKDGKLLAGERLPSTRSLAEYLQVARSTVEYAYEQLLSEGYIESRPHRGYFVCAMEELFRMEDSGKELLGERERAGNAQEETAWEYNFSPHEIDMSGFPFGVWKKITKNILTDGNSELFARGEAQGDHDLRETISRYLHSSRGVNCRPEQIIVGAGNDYLLMLLEKILGRHVRIAMENPTYIRTYRIFRSFAYDIVTVDMDESGMRTDCLVRENVRAAYVMPSHQFPMGTVMPIGRRTELLKWAAGASDRYLIEDDYDSEFRYHGKPIPALLASDRQGKVIYIGTFSKAIAPAIRVSFMVLPQSLLERYWRECSFYSCTVSRIDQRILNEFIRDGYFERHLNKMRKIYRAKQELLLRCLEPFKRDYTISGENTGLHLILTAKGDVSEEELLERAGRERVKVYGLSENMVEDSDRRATVLIGFGGLTQEQIAGGVERLRKAWL